MSRCIVALIFSFHVVTSWCSRIKIEDNGYKGVLVALPRIAGEEDGPRIVLNVESMLRSSSDVLQTSTKGRAHFSEVSFLVPSTWNIPEADPAWESTSFNASTFSASRAALFADAADVVITEEGRYPYVLHQNGCGQRAKRIILPKDFLLGEGEKGVEFARLWSEYRYGVFPEGGFQNDTKYPTTYRTPDEKEERITGCSDKTFWSSYSCDGDKKQCNENSLASSLMDQYLPSSARLFCEGSVSLGPKHSSEPPSKHNLMCGGEGTWFTVARSLDFAGGKNAAPRFLQDATDVSFRFVRENVTPRIIVAIETSSRMMRESRYLLIQPAFFDFVTSIIPYESELTVFLFGGDEGVTMVKDSVVVRSEESKRLFIETLPLPEDTPEVDNLSLEELFDAIFQTIGNTSDTKTSSPDIVVVTTVSRLNASAHVGVKQWISETESRLHVMQFAGDEDEDEDAPSLHDLCSETSGEFTSLHADAFGDLFGGFGKVIRDHDRHLIIVQDYLKYDEDDMDQEVSFVVDESLTEDSMVTLSFPSVLGSSALRYRNTTLRTPQAGSLNFLKLKALSSWVVFLPFAKVGEYVLRTRRVADLDEPVLILVRSRPTVHSKDQEYTSEDPISVSVWTEAPADSEATPPPVRIYAEVKKGSNPVGGARVTASIRHPDGETSRLTLLDDGLGDADITVHDGIYGSYFTNFTAPGFYNVHVKVSPGHNGTKILTGADDFCCGSFFPAASTLPLDGFQREAGPVTFRVPYFNVSSDTDRYPPSRVTDLRLESMYDRICVLHWTATGDDYNSGVAAAYEMKVFRDTAVIRNRFSGSGQELYSETIGTTPEATYGTTLNHAFQLPDNVGEGVRYISLRAVDDAGNAGEPSNAVRVSVEAESPSEVVDCGSEQDCENGGCEETPTAEKLQGNAARNLISTVMAFAFIPANVFVPIMSLILSLVLLNAL